MSDEMKKLLKKAGRVGWARNTRDDSMTLAELMGVPGADEETAIKLFIDGVSLGDTRKRIAEREHKDAVQAAKNAEGQEKRARGQELVEDQHLADLREVLQEHPEATHSELAEEYEALTGEAVSRRTIRRWCKNLQKQNTQ